MKYNPYMLLNIHPANPQARLIDQAISIVKRGGVIAYPTDCSYALGCHLADKEALARIRHIRQLDSKHLFTLICRDLSEISTYANIENWVFRLLKANTPGAYTFLLKASKQVPKILVQTKQKTIGIRVPGNPIAQSLLSTLGEPMLSSSLILPEDECAPCDAYEVEQRIGSDVDLIIDGGSCYPEPSTIIDLTGNKPVIIRIGQGSIDPFQ